MSDLELRPVEPGEFPAFHRALMETFGDTPRDEDRERSLRVVEFDRTLAWFDGGRIAGTAGAYTRDVTVPGGPRPAAGVTAVSVQPTHRRRGLLTGMMRRQLTDLHEQQREPVAVLWASEASIYGRFGYGLAARQLAVHGTSAAMRLRADAPAGTGRIVLADAEEARPHETAVYEALRPTTVGLLSRTTPWWDRRLYDPEHNRGGASARRHALHTEQDGTVTGYATYRTKQRWSMAGGPGGTVLVGDLMATTPQAYVQLWAFLTGIDLFPNLEWDAAPLDGPLTQLLADPRSLRSAVVDSLWVRVVDVGRALAARTYRVPVDVTIEVRDEFCPWNAGTWRLSGDASGAVCERTTDAPELTVSAVDLGAVHLGGPTLAQVASTGRVGGSPATLSAASLAFSGEREPWCPEIF
jgi:predicted acetyltransferase